MSSCPQCGFKDFYLGFHMEQDCANPKCQLYNPDRPPTPKEAEKELELQMPDMATTSMPASCNGCGCVTCTCPQQVCSTCGCSQCACGSTAYSGSGSSSNTSSSGSSVTCGNCGGMGCQFCAGAGYVAAPPPDKTIDPSIPSNFP